MEQNIASALHEMQKNLVCHKNQNNSFGGFKYRNCEDILASVKEVLPEGLCVVMSDEVVMVGDRYYVKATASLRGSNSSDSISASAFAREPLSKKGMDEPQLSGTASSYARKYALCALFSIDDSKTEPANEMMQPSPDVDSDFGMQSELNDIEISLMDCQTLEELQKNATKFASFYANDKAKNAIRGIFVKLRDKKFKTELK